MTFKKIIFYIGFLTLIACTAANKPRNQLGIQTNPNLSTLARSDFENGSGKKVRLPQNYSQENYKKLVLRVDVEAGKHSCSVGKNCPKTVNVPNLSARMLAELAKLKRFKAMQFVHRYVPVTIDHSAGVINCFINGILCHLLLFLRCFSKYKVSDVFSHAWMAYA